MGAWGQNGACKLQDLIDGVGMLYQPTFRKFACRLAREAVAGGGGQLSFIYSPGPTPSFIELLRMGWALLWQLTMRKMPYNYARSN